MDSLACSAWQIVYWILLAFRIAMLLYALVSWVPSLQGRWSVYVARFVEPVLMPIRRIIPPVGGLDLSYIVLVALISYLLLPAIRSAAINTAGCYIR